MKVDLATLFVYIDMPEDVRDTVTKLAALATSRYGAEGIAAWNKALELVERYGAPALPPPQQPPGKPSTRSSADARFVPVVGSCRYCSQPVVWTVTANGKPMPVDVESEAEIDCGFVLHYDGRDVRSTWTRIEDAGEEPVYTSHVGSCAARRAS
jgi:hypothetical protein